MIEVAGLSKHYGSTRAVDDLSFRVDRGSVTGFLGPNGAGKTTTLRMLLGLVRPSGGTATIDGKPYRALADPTATVGAVLEATAFHPGRSGRNHLRTLARAANVPDARVDEVLELVGLNDAARRRVKTYSLGMRQRLGIAAALLGEPEVLVLDEPANGLDPQGIRWLRDVIRGFAAEGGTVLVSSHVLAEIAQTVDDVVIVDKGKLVTRKPLSELRSSAAAGARVRSPQAARLRELLAAEHVQVSSVDRDSFTVGARPERIGELAAAHGIVLHELRPDDASLEDVFLELTEGTT
jgi:ABC-2 type transport system ATP-binding protein